jgi:DNA-binding response OmpR family regulator
MRTLLIEDNDDLRFEIAEYLTDRNHSVVECSTIAEARRELDQRLAQVDPPEAIICDVHLPDGDGVKFYVCSARRVPGCRWILMSGAHDQERLESEVSVLKGLPQCAVLEKPFSLRALNKALVEVSPAK